MTDCDRTELVGGYVLGALEPEERVEMERHLESCRACAREYRSLAVLPALLDQIEPDAVPPPLPPPELEEAVLDRVAKEAGRRAKVRRRARPFLAPRRLLLGVGLAAVAAAVTVALVLPDADGGSAYAHAELRGLPGVKAVADLASKQEGTAVDLHVRGLGAPRNTVYELWCIRSDGSWISGGTFQARNGKADVELTAAVRAGDYHRMVVTVRSGEHKRGPEVLKGELRY
jgi:anti-sigma-K factor RskA